MKVNRAASKPLIRFLLAGLISLAAHSLVIWLLDGATRKTFTNVQVPMQVVYVNDALPSKHSRNFHKQLSSRQSRRSKPIPSSSQTTTDSSHTLDVFSPMSGDLLSRQAIPKHAYKHGVQYPPLAEAMGIEGSVWLIVQVTREGKVRGAQVKKGIGYGCDESALAAVKQFEFDAALDGRGQRVDSIFEHEVQFRLD